MLIVQDDADVGELVHRILDGDGFCVTLVTTANQALTYLGTQRPAVILFDYETSGSDGRAFYADVRGRGIDSPAILLSAWNEGERLAEEIGVPFIAMPFDVDELLGSVRRAAEVG